MLNAANIYLFGIILPKCKYIYRSFQFLKPKKTGENGLNWIMLLLREGGCGGHVVTLEDIFCRYGVFLLTIRKLLLEIYFSNSKNKSFYVR